MLTAAALSAQAHPASQAIPAGSIVESNRYPSNIPYEYIESTTPRPVQRQQQNPTSLQYRPLSTATTLSSTSKTLRRTPRLRAGRAAYIRGLVPAPPVTVPVAFTRSGSTSPQSFHKLVQDDTFWPRRTTRISRRTHDAILFALEAIRSGRGVDALLLSSDPVEEQARMSDLYLPNQQGSQSQSGITTPRQIMALRTAREARRAQQQTQDVDPSRRRHPEDVVGVVYDSDVRRQQPQTQPQSSRPIYSDAEQSARLPAGQNVTIGGRTDIPPTTVTQPPRLGSTAVNQGQPRPVASQQAYPPQQSQLPATLQPGYPSYDASRIQRNRTEALDTLEMPAVVDARSNRIVPPQQHQQQQQQQQQQPTQQNTDFSQPPTDLQATRTAFPQAFERWETLSSHWEGLTSYWIRRLQANTDELDTKPIDKQMARQVTDLSAAGANLFHAVVELQRLRASSERKFQRWFVGASIEQKNAQEEIASLQEQLRQERMRKPEANSVATDATRAEKAKADEVVREMRRELQISKEEARRAWEELGRREQEERERTIALRSGEPTLIGGVQVLPMQGLSSRHNTNASQRPVTRDGPYHGGPTATQMGGQHMTSRSQTTLDSPITEREQYSYQPNATSPTDTDPFTEPSRATEPPLPLRHEPDTRFLSTGSPHGRQTAPQVFATSRASASPVRSQRSAVPRSEGPSYIPSTRSGAGSDESEEEYHIGPDGEYLRDPQGRLIPYRQPLGGYEDVATDDEDHTADVRHEQMLAAQFAQRQQLSHRPPPATSSQAPSRSPQPTLPSVYNQATTPQIQQSPYHQDNTPGSHHTASSTLSPATPQQHMSGQITSPPGGPVNYEGVGYGHDDELDYPPTTTPSTQPAVTTATHHVPSRLSDIPEEQRTEPSRSSAISNSEMTMHQQGGLFGTRRFKPAKKPCHKSPNATPYQAPPFQLHSHKQRTEKLGLWLVEQRVKYAEKKHVVVNARAADILTINLVDAPVLSPSPDTKTVRTGLRRREPESRKADLGASLTSTSEDDCVSSGGKKRWRSRDAESNVENNHNDHKRGSGAWKDMLNRWIAQGALGCWGCGGLSVCC